MENQNTSLTKLDDFTSAEEMLQYAGLLLSSKLLPVSIKTPEAALSVIVTGKELGFPAMASFNNIHVIEGKPTLGIHAITALVKRRGYAIRVVEDFVYVRADGSIDLMKNSTVDDQGKPVVQYADMRTTVEVYEPWHGQIITHRLSFYYTEAKAQGLTEKPNWKRMLRTMMRTRALTLVCRLAAPDALLGLYETTEAADFAKNPININITEDGGYAVVTE